MQIIDELENVPRGLSMGAIGVYLPDGFGVSPAIDLSVAIRTMVIRNGTATFNVGGGIVIDSDPEARVRRVSHQSACTAVFAWSDIDQLICGSVRNIFRASSLMVPVGGELDVDA